MKKFLVHHKTLKLFGVPCLGDKTPKRGDHDRYHVPFGCRYVLFENKGDILIEKLDLLEESHKVSIIPLAIKPKVMIVGHAQHGKDTVGDIFSRVLGMSTKPSSLFCIEK
jgi:hypothetical protein